MSDDDFDNQSQQDKLDYLADQTAKRNVSRQHEYWHNELSPSPQRKYAYAKRIMKFLGWFALVWLIYMVVVMGATH